MKYLLKKDYCLYFILSTYLPYKQLKTNIIIIERLLYKIKEFMSNNFDIYTYDFVIKFKHFTQIICT